MTPAPRFTLRKDFFSWKVFSTSSLRLPSNRYRQLFEKLGSEIYITAERVNGNVTLSIAEETITVTCQYENNRAAWDKAHGVIK